MYGIASVAGPLYVNIACNITNSTDLSIVWEEHSLIV